MDLAQLESFLEVVRLGSFRKAAQAQALSQPSLSGRIRALERDLGGPLFDRLGRGVALTPMGKALAPYAEKAIQAITEARQAVFVAKDAADKTLTMAVSRGIVHAVPPLIREFRAAHPGIVIRVRTGSSADVAQMVIREEVDVGLTLRQDHQEFVKFHLYDEEMVVVARPDHVLATVGEASLADLASETLVRNIEDTTYTVLLNWLKKDNRVVKDSDVQVQGLEAAKEMVLLGLGLSMFPRSYVSKELANRTLAAIALRDGPSLRVPTYIVWRRGRPTGPAVQAFLSVTRQHYTQPRGPMGVTPNQSDRRRGVRSPVHD